MPKWKEWQNICIEIKNNTNNGHIRARLEEGHTVDDFKMVIDKMNAKWGNDSKMVNYLRPETLFGTKFDKKYIIWYNVFIYWG